MTAPAGLTALIEELRALDERMLRLTLSALSRSEQTQVLRLLEGNEAPALSFETLAGISPWLMTKVDAARIAEASNGPAAGMTPVTRKALLAAFAGLGSEPDTSVAARPKRLLPGRLLRLGTRKKAA